MQTVTSLSCFASRRDQESIISISKQKSPLPTGVNPHGSESSTTSQRFAFMPFTSSPVSHQQQRSYPVSIPKIPSRTDVVTRSGSLHITPFHFHSHMVQRYIPVRLFAGRSDQIRLDQIRLDQIRLDQIRSNQMGMGWDERTSGTPLTCFWRFFGEAGSGLGLGWRGVEGSGVESYCTE
jgi:hypothetical protein